MSKSNFGGDFERKLMDVVDDAVVKRLRKARCPEHGRTPTDIRSHRRGTDLDWTFSTCCEKGKAAAQRTLAA
jgi:hypothetical protein